MTKIAAIAWIVVVIVVTCWWMPNSLHGQVRSIDGTGNNLAHENWGAADTQLNRLLPADYLNGIGNTLMGPPNNMFNRR